jgi:pyruvate/2-oxoglutarate/acetoin dehydrogenase E1 component/TPP-dependent pyruvate/acetoin dehydrogenase alpha subunit
MAGRSAGARTERAGSRTGTSVLLPRSGQALAPEVVRADYRVAYRSRAVSLVGRREVLSGKAKFGIFGDGKEVPQLAMAHAFKAGDWRCGYYRDQTFMLAAGMATVRQLFAQLYADTDIAHDPWSGGRAMNNHFGTRFIGADGRFVDTTAVKNTSSDLSPVASWMPVGLGLAYASKLYRENHGLDAVSARFSRQGQEVVFATIGDASTSEGPFLESINAAGVIGVPLLVSVWDDGYGISVPNRLQTATGSISQALRGMSLGPKAALDIHVIRGWDYPALCDGYALVSENVRRAGRPALLHVTELTQPQGHSTSGSHERYKTRERLAWEAEHDCLARMRAWMVEAGIAADEELEAWEREDRTHVEEERAAAWEALKAPIGQERDQLVRLLKAVDDPELDAVIYQLTSAAEVNRRLIQVAAFQANLALRDRPASDREGLLRFTEDHAARAAERYATHLYSDGPASPLKVPVVPPQYAETAGMVDGRQVLLKCFDANLERDPRIFALGEDVGVLGDVNLVFEGLQARHGELRLTDTGIRECTIMGQAIGAAMRGLRPIADIQYLDYLAYALQLISDYLATLRWRTAGGQAAPVIVRTKGHRLQGVWHAGSPMGTILSATAGVHVCVPRDMTQVAGMYNTLLRGDDPAIVVEVLNAYRLKERLPDNVGEFTVPLGVVEVLRAGRDITVVTYGACCAIALDAAVVLRDLGIEIEVIDVQTLAPFDTAHSIVESLRKTSALLVLDEDVPGGASAHILRQVLEVQSGFWHLDSEPRTLTAAPHRTPYGADGEYFTKPGREDLIRAVYALVRERDPARFPALFD